MALHWIAVETELADAPATPGLIYRTRPKVGFATNGKRYFFKGGSVDTVMAEVLGYSAATAVSLNVPPWALCRVPPGNDIWFASEALAFSGAVEPLVKARAIANPDFLGSCVAFDIWTANVDRNIGNIVADAAPGLRGRAELYAIDFEQARVLNGTDFLTVGALHSRDCWPKGVLAGLCSGLPFPQAMCSSIARTTARSIDAAFADLALDTEFPSITWIESTKRQLLGRAARIDSLVREAWDDAR